MHVHVAVRMPLKKTDAMRPFPPRADSDIEAPQMVHDVVKAVPFWWACGVFVSPRGHASVSTACRQ
eukprot:1160869-Pelagomonas_calceolata.AAC.9